MCVHRENMQGVKINTSKSLVFNYGILSMYGKLVGNNEQMFIFWQCKSFRERQSWMKEGIHSRKQSV